MQAPRAHRYLAADAYGPRFRPGAFRSLGSVPHDRTGAIHEIPTIFRGARGFGLSDSEIWETVNEVCERLPPGKIKPEDLATDEIAHAEGQVMLYF